MEKRLVKNQLIDSDMDFGCLQANIPPVNYLPEFNLANKRTAFQQARIHSLALDISGNCNLNCKYCVESITQPRRQPMSTETLITVFDFLKTLASTSDQIFIRFTSGEPLINKPLLVQFQEMLEDFNKPIKVFLTTNGTRIDRKMAAWLGKKKWAIKISLDGPAWIHNSFRVFANGNGSYTEVTTALNYSLEFFPNELSVSAVLSHGVDPSEVFWHIAALGVNKIDLVPISHNNTSYKLTADDLLRYEKFLTGYTQRILSDGVGKTPVLIPFERAVQHVLSNSALQICCSAGRSLLGVGPDGILYPCHRFIGMEAYQIGHIATCIINEARENFFKKEARFCIERPECLDCWAASLCGGPCFANVIGFGRAQDRPIFSHCYFTRTNIYQAINLINILKENNPIEILYYFSRNESFIKHITNGLS